MGSRETNFYVDLTHRFGFGEVADEVQGCTWTASARTPTTAIPDELVDATSLVGSEDEVAARGLRFGRPRDNSNVSLGMPSEQQLHTWERLAAWTAG